MKFALTTAIVTSVVCMAGTPAFAGDVEDAIIAKVIAGYGGDDFTRMKSFTAVDATYSSTLGQTVDTGMPRFAKIKRVSIFDPAQRRSSIETFQRADNFVDHRRQTKTDDGYVGINYFTAVYAPDTAENYYQAVGPMLRSTDTMLAYELATNPELAEATGETIHLGRLHDLVTYNLPESPPLTLFVDQTSGHITRMQRVTNFGNLEYLFSDFASDNGVDYAQNFQFLANGNVMNLTIRDVKVNEARAKDYAMDSGIVQEPEPIDDSEMSANKLADGYYLVGQNGGFTLFVENGAGVIGMGGYAGLEDRLTAYHTVAGHTKPLTTHIVTHHHNDHIAGIPEAYALGAKLIMTPDSVEPVLELIEGNVPESRYEILEADKDLGPLRLLRVSTSHADQNIMPYIPSMKTLFQADHYGSQYVDVPGTTNGNGASMKAAIEAKAVDVEKIISAHGAKVESWDDFASAVAAIAPYECYKGRKICR